jgi:hypothetical protein
MFAEDPIFYSNVGDSGIYLSFRKEKLIRNVIVKPTGPARDETLCFKGTYPIKWKTIVNRLKYFVIEV